MKQIFALFLMLVLVFSFTACSEKTEEDLGLENVQIDSALNNQEDSDINMNYLEYASQTSCAMLVAVKEGKDVLSIMEDAMNYEQYGLTQEEVETYGLNYEGSQEFALLAYARMLEICGDTLKELGVDEYTPQ